MLFTLCKVCFGRTVKDQVGREGELSDQPAFWVHLLCGTPSSRGWQRAVRGAGRGVSELLPPNLEVSLLGHGQRPFGRFTTLTTNEDLQSTSYAFGLVSDAGHRGEQKRHGAPSRGSQCKGRGKHESWRKTGVCAWKARNMVLGRYRAKEAGLGLVSWGKDT